MGENSKISWTHHTWNPWRGCEHATLADGSEHPGCLHCYAERMSKRNPRVMGTWGADGVRVRAADAYWKLPAKWNAAAIEAGQRQRVFCASVADVFEDWQGPIVAPSGRVLHRGEAWYSQQKYIELYLRIGRSLATMDDLRRDVFGTIDANSWLDWLVLTKRPQNVQHMMPLRFGERCAKCGMSSCDHNEDPVDNCPQHVSPENYCRPNLWLGTSISNQQTANELVLDLIDLCDLCTLLFLSAEPLLGPVRLSAIKGRGAGYWDVLRGLGHDGTIEDGTMCPTISWVIIGCESGARRRPMQLEWARDLVRQCRDAGVAVFVKQLEIDGQVTEDVSKFPRDLQVRELPATAGRHNTNLAKSAKERS
jgi:protein gp37